MGKKEWGAILPEEIKEAKKLGDDYFCDFFKTLIYLYDLDTETVAREIGVPTDSVERWIEKETYPAMMMRSNILKKLINFVADKPEHKCACDGGCLSKK